MSVLEPEAGIWYAACWIAVGARFISKRVRLGSWRLQIDDYLVVPAMVTLTILLSLLHIIVYTRSNLIAPGEDVSTFSSEEIRERIYGSKLTIVSEQMQILTIWLLKACMLIMYGRMTGLLPLHLAVKGVAIYVGLSFILMESLWFGVWCRPFNQYWAVPTNSVQCSAMLNHLITNAVLNISSDLMILAIPIPLVIKVKLPVTKKLILGGMFSMGIVTIFAAGWNKYKSFSDPFSTGWIQWYLREAFTAMLCTNLPLTRPLIEYLFKTSPWITERQYFTSRYGTSRLGSDFRLDGETPTPIPTPKAAVFKTTVLADTTATTSPKPLPSLPTRLSEEYIGSQPLQINYRTSITIERHDADSEDSSLDIPIMLEGQDENQRQRRDADAMSIKSRPKSVITTCYHEVDDQPAPP